jgi:hypothetical protein
LNACQYEWPKERLLIFGIPLIFKAKETVPLHRKISQLSAEYGK